MIRLLGNLLAPVVRWAYSRDVVPGIDTRGIPSHECLNCGSNVFNIRAGFEDWDIAFWFTEGTCAQCKAPVTVPTPCDDPDHEHEHAYDYEGEDGD